MTITENIDEEYGGSAISSVHSSVIFSNVNITNNSSSSFALISIGPSQDEGGNWVGPFPQVKFENVLKVHSKNINQTKKDKFLDFLTIETIQMPDNNYEMKLVFAGDSIIKVISEEQLAVDVKPGSKTNIPVFE